MLILQAGPVVRVVRRGSGSVVTWRRAQVVLLSAQGTDVALRVNQSLHRPGPRACPIAGRITASFIDPQDPRQSTNGSLHSSAGIAATCGSDISTIWSMSRSFHSASPRPGLDRLERGNATCCHDEPVLDHEVRLPY